MAERIAVPVAEFAFTGKGSYVWKADRRELFQIVHPWVASKAGDFGQMETQVAVPAEAKPPFTLVFYVMDNNYTGPENTGADWINRELRVGHRFRQALVNGEVVWQEDTCLDDTSQHYRVDVSGKVKPGQPFRLAFRLWEAADSSAVLPGDVYITEYYASKVATATKKVEKDRYETKSYWGDVAVYAGAVPEPEEIPWGWRTVLKAPRPELPKAAPAVKENVTLRLEKAELLDGPWPWPVTQGVPFPMGALPDPASLAFAGADGTPLATAAEQQNAWPDGSLMWTCASFTLPATATGPFALQYGRDVRPGPVQPVHAVTATADFTVGNGLVSVRPSTAGAAGVAIALGDGRTVVPGLAPYLRAGSQDGAVTWTRRDWLARSPLRAEFALDGEMATETGERYGTCRLRVAVFADCPYVRLLFTLTNQRAEEAVGANAAAPAATGWWLSGKKQGPDRTFSAEAYGLRLQTSDARPVAAGDGWTTVATGGGHLTATVRWLKHLWPNGIETTPAGIDLQFFKPGDARLAAYNTHPGEAKTQEVWVAVTEDAPAAADGQRFAALVETPPRLDVSAMIRASQAWGPLPEITPERHADVHAAIQSTLAPYFEKCKENIRLFGEYGNWDNYYWNTLHTMFSLYAMTGERRWFDWAERSIRHHFDVDICHWQPEKDPVGAVGAMHGYWGDHSNTPSYSLIQNCDGAFDHWNLTGDPDGREFGVGIAEYVRTSPNIGRGGSSREQGWPIICTLAAWRQTGEAKYGEHARLLAETALGFEEKRRGTYIENHGSVSYLGPTPFMYGILCTALRQYHLRTGDERAAILVARLANSVYEEAHDPLHSKTLPNIDYYYSPNPYLRGGDGFTPITTLNLGIAAMQAYGAHVTQDSGLADIAKRSWLAGLNGGTVYPEMSYDLAGIVWWLDRLAEAAGGGK